MYRYAAYGLTVSSALPLPELMPDSAVHGAATREIVIRSGPVSSRPIQLDANGFGFQTDGVDACHVLDKRPGSVSPAAGDHGHAGAVAEGRTSGRARALPRCQGSETEERHGALAALRGF